MFDADGDVLALCSTRARAHLLKREVAVVRLGRGRWTLDTALIEGASLVRLRPAT